MLKNYICVYDYETDSADPKTTNPVQISAGIIDPKNFDLLNDSFFDIGVKPPNIDDENYYKEHLDTIKWHAKNYNCTPEEIFERWKQNTEEKTAWNHFIEYLKRWNCNQSRKTQFSAPIRAGANIRRFDDFITQRLCEKYGNINNRGEMNIFAPRDSIDILDFAFLWFCHLPEPKSYSMDTLRPFFGLSSDGAHDGLKDVKDEGWIISKFMKLHKNQAPRINFKNAARN